jgi:uncharacterized protein
MKARRACIILLALAAIAADAPASDLPDHFARLAESDVSIVTASGTHQFKVWVAADELSRQRGLMHVRDLPAGRGMLFLFDAPRFAAFWMKDTYVPLDLAFIDTRGVVVNIARDAKPLSLDPIPSVGPVGSVLELAGGTAARIGLKPGDPVTVIQPTPSRAP